MLNAISVDVEEYFHAANLFPVAGPRRWRRLPSRVKQSTIKVLELFRKNSVKGTFFVLGYCARRYPELVKMIAEDGHEIASHGYGHRIAYNQSQAQFLRDITLAKQILEDIVGKPVIGYRAPNFSITNRNQWAYESLIAAGYRYDSSQYPVWHPRYANLDKSLVPQILTFPNGKLYSFPLAVAEARILNSQTRLPVAGGAYWRLLPKRYCAWGLDQIQSDKRWFTCYFHPWELDTEQPVFGKLPFPTRLRHYGGIKKYPETIEYFLKRYKFVPIAEAAIQSFPDFPNNL